MPSSAIRSFAYEAQARRLTILFVSGRTYAYDGVPREIPDALAAAPSRGVFFNTAVRNRFIATRLPRANIA